MSFKEQSSQPEIDVKSKSSCSHARSSVRSTDSSLLMKKQIKAEAARAKTEFIQKEAELRKQRAVIDEQVQHSTATANRQKAELEVDLELVQNQKEIAVAEAEVHAIQSVIGDNIGSIQEPYEEPLHLPIDNPINRTQEYVNKHSRSQTIDTDIKFRDTRSHVFNAPIRPDSQAQFLTTELRPNFQTPKGLNPNIAPFVPHNSVQISPPIPPVGFELTQFLLKKELLLSSFSTFNDKPESYAIWKARFQSTIQELNVNTRQEIDLLVKWLGPESSKQADSLRSSNVHNPDRGLQRIWARLNERYGSPEMIESALKAKLQDFRKLSNKDNKKLYELADLLSEIESIKEDQSYTSLLSYFDTSSGINPIVNKLPYSLQEKWTTEALRYKRQYGASFPPFTVFVKFVCEISQAKNDPSFMYDTGVIAKTMPHKGSHPKTTVFAKKTDINQQSPSQRSIQQPVCPLHNTNHSLNMCKGFRYKPLDERKELVQNYGICFKCCTTNTHQAKDCNVSVRCNICNSERHATAMHVTYKTKNTKPSPVETHGGEKNCEVTYQSTEHSTKCTQICGDRFQGKSCAKTILVKTYPKGQKDKATLMYAILDDQSNVSLAKPKLFELLDIDGEKKPYTLSSCTGNVTSYGRRAYNCCVESLDGSTVLDIPYLIECDNIPDVRQEIPTPQVAQAYPHLEDLSTKISPLQDNPQILLLIGRDILPAHHVIEQRLGPPYTPFAQKLRLGWVIIGQACLGKSHKPDTVTVSKTYIHADSRPSLFAPCPNKIDVKERESTDYFLLGETDLSIGHSVFHKTQEDEKIGMSREDRTFLTLMDNDVFRNQTGNCVAPLPFREPRVPLPNNRPQALKRAKTLHKSLQKDPVKKQHMFEFMQRIFDDDHAELAPSLLMNEECWYLPIFGIYHPKKPGQIRAVFDSSAQYCGISLNNTLLTGPDLTNNLLGILMRFRKDRIALIADIQQMFYCFIVREDHRNYLRFLWYKDNDPDQELTEYRMRVHVFGNAPSPAVATYCLRRAVQLVQDTFGQDTTEFVENNFYVDDGITSLSTEEQAIDLMKRTKQALSSRGNINLHKIASNSTKVLNSFPTEDLAKDLRDLDLGVDDLPLQRSLGMVWNLNQDAFTFRVSTDIKPYTKRGILSTVNSIFDPLGIAAPVVVQGKSFLRDLIPSTNDWDDPLPSEHRGEWEHWRDSLTLLENLSIPRTYQNSSFSQTTRKDVHVFSDASEKAIAAVAYLRTQDNDGSQHISFVLGKAKLAPVHGHSIPRLELCAAVLAVEISEIIVDQLNIDPGNIYFHTDSRVVLGYINNQTRRFYIYVSNRVDRIRRSSNPDQWSYVSTDRNPVDCATRPLSSYHLPTSPWLTGPAQLLELEECQEPNRFPLMEPDDDKELRPLTTMVSNVEEHNSLGTHRFDRFSSWKVLVRSIACLKHIARSYHDDTNCRGWHMDESCKSVELYTETELHILKEVQHETYHEEINSIKSKKPLPKGSPLMTLNPVIDSSGLLRVGGRLNNADISPEKKNPLIIPGRHHIASLLILHHHQLVRHQGRHLTEGAVRRAGLWIIGGKRLVSSLLHKCVMCRRLRGKTELQKMSNLPIDRLQPAPPFTFVGVDTFGPWTVISRRTRGGQANSKRWAIMFSCLTTRAVHIEVVEDMSSSCFINALRRFVALRGEVKQFRSDRGTNFVGACKELHFNAINVEDEQVKHYLLDNKSTWIFNPPHSSHMGGAWERMIGVARRILDSIMAETSHRNLTHEVLITFMAEVCAIMNSRPIIPVSSDPQAPDILSPSMLLTQKTGHIPRMEISYDIKELYTSQWKRVQSLSDTFWCRWRKEYLHTLQCRRKWTTDRPNVNPGDVVLLRDKGTHRNEWPFGLISRVFPGDDGNVRKVEIRIMKDGIPVNYVRPITEVIVLVQSDHT